VAQYRARGASDHRYRSPLAQRGPQNSRHGEKIHAIATGREHRCSGWAGLHRRRSTACGLKKRVVNADAGSEFIAPSSQHPSHMPLHLECPGGAETVARQQPWSNREPPMSGVLDPALQSPPGSALRGSHKEGAGSFVLYPLLASRTLRMVATDLDGTIIPGSPVMNVDGFLCDMGGSGLSVRR